MFWKYVVSDELQEKRRWVSDSNMLEILPAHLMGFQRLQSNRVVQNLPFWQTLSCWCPGAGFPVSLQTPCHACMNHRSFGSAFQVRSEVWARFLFQLRLFIKHAVGPNTNWGSQKPQEHLLCISAALLCYPDSQQPSSKLLCCPSDLLILLQPVGKDELGITEILAYCEGLLWWTGERQTLLL